MPAYFDTGFSVREPMWHGEGSVLTDYPTDWADARKKAGLLWEPESMPSFTTVWASAFVHCAFCGEKEKHDIACEVGGAASRMKVETIDCLPPGSQIGHSGKFAFVPDPDHQQIVRNDTGKLLGIPTDSFSLIYHGKDHARSVGAGAASMEEIIEFFCGIKGIKFETAGSCKEGAFVWALMYLDEPFAVPGDSSEHLPFRALINNHDGSGACKLIDTIVRIVCWNTFQMASAEGDRTGRQIVFRHTGDVDAKIEEVKESITDMRQDYRHYVELAETMMKVKASPEALEEFLVEFLPNPAEHGEVITDRVAANIEGSRGAFRSKYNGVTCEDVAGTAWGIVQASTEYLDWVRNYRTRDTFLGRSILTPEANKEKALAICGDLFSDGLAKLDDPWADRLVSMGESYAARRREQEKMLLTR
jgi:phage/plasmid-like protein (TIGR03299 family)